MGKTKFKTRYSFRGRRRRQYRKLPIDVVDETLTSSTPGDITDRPATSIMSATGKKMELLGLGISPDMMEIKANAISEPKDLFIFVQMSSLNRLLSFSCCPLCKQSGITFSLIDGKEMGFAVKGKLFCSNCEQSFAESYLSERVGGSQSSKAPFEVNLRSTFAFMGIGCGYSAIRDWSTVMNTSSYMSKLAFQGSKNNIIAGSRESFEEIAKRSVEKIRERYRELGIVPDKDDVLDVAVSLMGVGIVVDTHPTMA